MRSTDPLDVITLTGLRRTGHHGVFGHEKRAGQEFIVDVTLHLDLAPAGSTDDLARTVDYGTVARTVSDLIATGSVDLVETLADRIAAAVLAADPRIRAVGATVHKPQAPIDVPFDDVTVAVTRRAAPVRAVLALGSNLGDRHAALRRAVASLAAHPDVDLVTVSPPIESAPVGGVEQDDFLNAVAIVTTGLAPRRLLALAHELERAARRVRTVRWGPRTLDVDVITWGDLVDDDPVLTLPHPRAYERAFVLSPWHRIDPGATLPGPAGGPVAELLARAADRDGLREVPGGWEEDAP